MSNWEHNLKLFYDYFAPAGPDGKYVLNDKQKWVGLITLPVDAYNAEMLGWRALSSEEGLFAFADIDDYIAAKLKFS